MKKRNFWLLVAILFVVSGCILFATAMTVNGWDFTKLNTVKYQTSTHQINEDFSEIVVETSTADVTFLHTADDTCKIVCVEETNLIHTVAVLDGKLTVRETNTKQWYEYIGINFGLAKITVYLPNAEYGSLNVSTHTGDVSFDDFSFGTISIATSTGDVNAKNLSAGEITVRVSTGNVSIYGSACTDLSIETSTGEVDLQHVIALSKFTIKTSTGDVSFNKCDASEIYVSTSTGDVGGTLLTPKNFDAFSNTGNVNVPTTSTGGACQIRTSTGSVNISIAQ